MGRSMGFDFIEVNTNGLRVASHPAYAGELKDAGSASLFLQFDGLRDSIHVRLRGASAIRGKTARSRELRQPGPGCGPGAHFSAGSQCTTRSGIS